ncbi:MAG: nucleotidyltransferase family protein [Ardenticatenaceae bacterium]|nr:nucleotidyltransferase family protein [Ardenticatenaceae bacterium]
MKTLEDMTYLIQQALPELRRQYGVRDLWLFGSYIRAEQGAESDLDVLVEFDNPRLTLIEFIQLEQQLSQLLGIKVDLVERDTLKPEIGKRILQEAVAL